MRRFRDLVRSVTDRARPAAAGAESASEPDGSASSTGDGGPLPDELTADLADLTARRQHADALALIAANLDSRAHDRDFLHQVEASARKAGSLSVQRQAVARRQAAWPDAALIRHARRLEGRWNETSADWSPTIRPSLIPVDEPVKGRVLHVLKVSMPHRQSGYTMRSMYTLAGQRAVGLDVVATTALDFPANAGVVNPADVDDVAGVPHRRLLRDTIPKKQPWDSYLDDWASALAPLVAEQRPEVIHVHSGHRGYDSALVALAVGRALDIPVVYEVRGFFESLWTDDLAQAERSEVFQRRYETDARCMREAAAVVTLSEAMRAEIIARGAEPDRVHVVPNGVDVDAFSPRPRRSDLVESLGLDGRFVFGYVSNLDHLREGHELLIEAATRLRDKGVPATALIVGDGARREELETLSRTLGAEDVVIFTGRVPHAEILDYYALYDVFVVPRVNERAARLVTPLKPFEAMAAEIPVVVSDLAALREIVGDGTRGRTFRHGDVDSLVTTLIELHGDAALRRSLAVAAREWVVAERQWSANGSRYRAIYDHVRESGPGPA